MKVIKINTEEINAHLRKVSWATMNLFKLTLSSLIIPVVMYGHSITTSDGAELYVTVKGDGIPCLYIHGGPGAGSHWLKKFYGGFLEQRFQMIYLDQRGVCRSTSPMNGDFSIDRIILDFEEVRTSLGIDEWLTLGHSFGGVLQMKYAISYPESIKGMLMINCTLNARESLNKNWIPKACEFLGIENPNCYTDDTVPLMDRLSFLSQQLKEQGMMWKMGYQLEKNMRIMSESFKEIPEWNHDFESIALTVDDYMMDYKPNTVDVEVPVLFFYGRKDWMVGPEHFQNVKFPRMILWGSDVGHMPFLESRADLDRAIDIFLIESFEDWPLNDIQLK